MNSLNKTATETNDVPSFGMVLMHVGVGSIIFNSMKVCTKCGIPKESSEFYETIKRGRKVWQSSCKDCFRAMCDKSRKRNDLPAKPIINLSDELWKPVVGYEGLYEISSLGRVKSLGRTASRDGFSWIFKEKLRSPALTKKGYHRVGLRKEGNSNGKLVHRLVAEAFIPNPNNKPEINHIWGIKTDNRVTELEWSTPLENVRHSYAILGRTNDHFIGRTGKLCPNSKAVRQLTIDGREVAVFDSIKEAIRITGFSCIHGALKGKWKQSGGYKWEYIKKQTP